MLKVIAQNSIKPEQVDAVLPLYRELVAKTRQEADCLGYDLFIDQKDPGHFVFIETWPDRAALDAHCRSEHFTRPPAPTRHLYIDGCARGLTGPP